MARKIEFGAGIVAGVLAVATLIYLLFVPLDYCLVPLKNGNCPPNQTARPTLPQLHLDASVWLILLGLLALLVAGAAGAVAEARFNEPRGAPVLWVGAVLSIMACALTGGVGILYLGGILALSVAGYASIMPRIRSRRGTAAPEVSPPQAKVEREVTAEPEATAKAANRARSPTEWLAQTLVRGRLMLRSVLSPSSRGNGPGGEA